MKKHTDFLLIFLGIGVITLIIFIVYRSQQPEPVTLDFTKQAQTREHTFISDILDDTENFIAKEDVKLDQNKQTESITSAPLSVVCAPLPVAWDSKSAPNLGEVELSLQLQRSLAASASLRSEDYTDPSSELNSACVEALCAIRQKRHKNE